MATVHIQPIDPRDQAFETDSPRYRVYFFDPPRPGGGFTSYEYEVDDAADVSAVIAWAESERGPRTYVLYVRPAGDATGVHLVRLLGHDPNESPAGHS